MLIEVSIRDFAIIDELRLSFEPGLNVMTGETGAGKSIIIDALGAVLGERIGSDVVRSGAKVATVEAIFDVASMRQRTDLLEFAAEFGVDLEEGSLILSREVAATGRSTARINGRATTASALARAAALLVDIHGQSDHLSLLRQPEHLNVLDRFAGTLSLRAEVSRIVHEIRTIRGSLETLIKGERERDRQIDLLSFQVTEIEEANLETGEEERLVAERDVLINAERLAAEATEVHDLLVGDEFADGDGSPAIALIQRASAGLDAIALIDPSMTPAAERLREVVFSLEDVIADSREYRDRVEADPARLEDVDERLDLIRKLKRKYGETIADVIDYGRNASTELASLTSGEFDAESLKERERDLLASLSDSATRLSEERRSASRRLELGVEAIIAELNMGRARFAVQFDTRPSEIGVSIGGGERIAFDETGIDRVEFMLAANSGEALKPLSRVASGGEMARLMLALKSILAVADETPTLVFDEVDVGVGGRSGQVVGEKLWGLTREHQVIVITHLPQIAAFAEAHYRIAKAARSGRIVSSVVQIAGDERIDEVAAMLDGVPVTTAARENARQMIERVSAWKAGAALSA